MAVGQDDGLKVDSRLMNILDHLSRRLAWVDTDGFFCFAAGNDPGVLLKRGQYKSSYDHFANILSMCGSGSKVCSSRPRKTNKIASRYVLASGLPVKQGVSTSVRLR